MGSNVPLRVYGLQDFRMGGVARLWKGTVNTGGFVVHRQLQEQYRFDWKMRAKFKYGIKIRKKLGHHENIVWSFRTGIREFLPYELIDFVNGPSLQVMLVQEPDFIKKHGLNLLVQMAEGIRHCHAAGYLHLDIKAGNFLIDVTNREKPLARLTDFDLAMPLKGTKPNKSLRYGTFNYMAPELLDRGQISAESDIFSFGVLAYNMYSGRMPYPGGTPAESRKYKMDPKYPIVPLKEKCAIVPQKLNDIVGRCLEKDAAMRYSDMTRIVRDLATTFLLQQLPPDDKTRTLEFF